MFSIDRAAYRVRQLRRSLLPRVTRAERDDTRLVLGPQLFPLFASMQPADQRHCLDVHARLVAGGCTNGEMLQAALIHDAGKSSIAGARFGMHHRIVYVVLQGFPGLLDGLARRNRGIRSLHQHDQRTIELAREYGASDGVVRLLLAIDGHTSDERAAALMAADDQS
ncbi:MAG: hypothetical protein AAB092_00745 [Chloroflexota bacterium]